MEAPERSLPGDDATAPQQQGEQERRHHGNDDGSKAAEAIRIESDHVLSCERPTIDDLVLDRLKIRGRAQGIHAHDPGRKCDPIRRLGSRLFVGRLCRDCVFRFLRRTRPRFGHQFSSHLGEKVVSDLFFREGFTQQRADGW